MIQRIQTIWLLIASALGFISLKTSVYSGHLINDATKTFVSVTGNYDKNILLSICTIAIAIISLIAVFLFKNRKQQMKFCIVAFTLSLFLLFLYYWQTQSFIRTESHYNLASIIPLFIPVFIFLALRGMYKDEKLVQGTDRLR